MKSLFIALAAIVALSLSGCVVGAAGPGGGHYAHHYHYSHYHYHYSHHTVQHRHIAPLQ